MNDRRCEVRNMDDFNTIPLDYVIKEAQTTDPKYCDKKYVVYYNIKEKGQTIHINTYYIVEGDVINLCKYYDRRLCDTIEEYKRLDESYIESQAYGSWMDGAR